MLGHIENHGTIQPPGSVIEFLASLEPEGDRTVGWSGARIVFEGVQDHAQIRVELVNAASRRRRKVQLEGIHGNPGLVPLHDANPAGTCGGRGIDGKHLVGHAGQACQRKAFAGGWDTIRHRFEWDNFGVRHRFWRAPDTHFRPVSLGGPVGAPAMEQGYRSVGFVVGIEERIRFQRSRPAGGERSNLDPNVSQASWNAGIGGLKGNGKDDRLRVAQRPMQAGAVARRLQRCRRDQRSEDGASLFVREGHDSLAVAADGQLQILAPFESGGRPEIFDLDLVFARGGHDDRAADLGG